VSAASEIQSSSFTFSDLYPLLKDHTQTSLDLVPYMVSNDGWALGPGSELLFWVPPELRKGLMRKHDLLVIGAKFITTKLNLESFEHGVSWINCRDDIIVST
jgi:hypothetical protein